MKQDRQIQKCIDSLMKEVETQEIKAISCFIVYGKGEGSANVHSITLDDNIEMSYFIEQYEQARRLTLIRQMRQDNLSKV